MLPRMRATPLPLRDETGLVHASAAGFLLAAFAAAWLAPPLFWVVLAAGLAAGGLVVAFRHLRVLCVAWLLVAGTTLEMTLSDLLGPAAFQTTIAAVKAAEAGLALLCALRYGPRLDVFNPAWGFAAMAAVGLAHGLHPGLTPADSLRSLAGSVAPFLFCFSRLSPVWAAAMIRATAWCAVVAVAAGACLDLAGLRPLFVDSGGARLAALGHPAYLAEVCLGTIYACLIELFRRGRVRDLLLLAVNLIILLLTGARAPLASAVLVIGCSLAFVRAAAFPVRWRLLLVLSVLAVLPMMAVLAGDLASVRLFNLLNSDFGNLSGREYLWPWFEAAAADSPWFGWGIGAGNVVIPPEGEIARLLHTWAAHNEYLRIQVEGGQVGRALLILLFILWVRGNTGRLCASDRGILRLAFLALAVHAGTDNVLISTPACVLFAFATAVFARGRHEAGQQLTLPDSPPLA